jgi:hypothetical protein
VKQQQQQQQQMMMMMMTMMTMTLSSQGCVSTSTRKIGRWSVAMTEMTPKTCVKKTAETIAQTHLLCPTVSVRIQNGLF